MKDDNDKDDKKPAKKGKGDPAAVIGKGPTKPGSGGFHTALKGSAAKYRQDPAARHTPHEGQI